MTTTPAMPEFEAWWDNHKPDTTDAYALAEAAFSYALAALQSQPAAETALQKFVRLNVADEVLSPLEQLRSFCSFAMSGQDWIDCEPFFDAIVESAQPAAAGVSDAEIVAALEAAGVKFQRFMGGITGTKDCWSTAGSQDVRKLLAGVRAILALRPQSESEQEKELRRSLAEAQATISERNAEIIELQKRLRRSPQAVPMTDAMPQDMGQATIMGDCIYAGIFEDEVSEVKSAVVIKFESDDKLRDFLRWHHGITAPAGGEG